MSEYISGETLRGMLKGRAGTVDIVKTILASLSVTLGAPQQGIAHRDVTPSKYYFRS